MQLVYVYTTVYICFYYICIKYGHTQVVYHLSLIYLLMYMFSWVVEFDEEYVEEMVREKPIVWLNLNLVSLSQLETILSNCICEGVYWLRYGLVSKRSLALSHSSQAEMKYFFFWLCPFLCRTEKSLTFP